MKKVILISLLLFVPLVAFGLTAYEKDEATGVVAQNCKATIELLSAKRPADESAEIGPWVIARNHSGRVYIPGDGVAWDVVVITKGEMYVVASGITNAPSPGKVTPIFVRIRQEEEVADPKAPIVEDIE